MASTFRPVNSPTAIKIDSRGGSAPSPTTPTPTKATFSQRPLPTHPFPQAVKIPENIDEVKVLEHDNLQHSGRISHGESEDVDMDESDREAHGNDDGAESDEEDSVNADSSKSGKQKKNQRFWCTEYPPCHLSFTRSEHLARHIRKHTGERPFQCHCSRRFSRLDNLRQHAQTVHVNEEIPLDSLAAAGTRFQRQLRTDRVRQPGRARAATAGSIGGPTRGHAKSLSTSSIGSVGSAFSTGEDARRRPPPLVMAETGIRYLPDAYIPQRPPSPSDFSTPTSATFSTGHNSPHWGQVMTSTPSAHSRSHSAYGSSVPARRLSVPTDGMPFQFQHGGNGRPMLGLGSPMGGSHPAPFSPASSVIPSPTSSIYSRRESLSGTEDWRRRTWHPDSNFNAKPPASRLGQLSHAYPPLQYPSPPQNHVHFPAQQQQQSNASVRLPGIESFGPVPHRPASPLKNVSSPMLIEPDVVHPRALHPTAHATESEDKRSAANWDMNLHRGLIRLDITSNATPSDNASIWAREANQAMDAQVDRVRRGPPTVRFNEPVIADNPPKSASPHGFHKYTMSAPSIASSRESKRRGWHQSGIQAEGPPEKTARIDRMVHPNVREFSGFPARESHPSGPAPRDQNPGDRAMGRLEALVAVATGEGNATKAY